MNTDYAKSQNTAPWVCLPLTDLPPLPEEFHNYDYAYDMDISGITDAIRKVRDRRITKRNGVTVPNIVYQRWNPKSILEDWVKNNICSDYINLGLSSADPAGATDIQGPHVDLSRDAVLHWIYNTGGPNVETVFYQQEGYDLVQPSRNNYPNSYDSLTEVDRYCMKPGTWHILNTRIMHSVENLKSERLTLQIGLDIAHLPSVKSDIFQEKL